VDNSVAVFGKITRNEIDEEFRFVQKQLCDTTADLLRVHLKAKFALKSDDVIHGMAEGIETGLITSEQWGDIIQYMYNGDDATALNVMLRDAARKHASHVLSQAREKEKERGRERTTEGAEGSNNKLKYSEFLKVLLDFQLLGHDKFLHKFREKFGEVDSDKNGIINESEFRALCSTIGKPRVKGNNGKNVTRSEEEMCDLLERADKYNNQQITFSECVAVLSGDIIEMVTDLHDRQVRTKELGEKRNARGMGR